MTKTTRNFFLLITISFLSACASAPGGQTKQLAERDGVDVLLIPAAYREAYFSSTTSPDRHCRAPDPDFTVQQNDQLNITLPANGNESLGAGDTQTEVNLGGRTEKVVLTRELMYRACELVANINADTATSIEIYTKFLQVLQVLVNTPSESASAAAN
jgi:hypothetical protein